VRKHEKSVNYIIAQSSPQPEKHNYMLNDADDPG